MVSRVPETHGEQTDGGWWSCCASATDFVGHRVRIRVRLYPCLYVTAAREVSHKPVQAINGASPGTEITSLHNGGSLKCTKALIL